MENLQGNSGTGNTGDTPEPPAWLVRLVSQIGPPQPQHDCEAPEVLAEMLRKAEAFFNRQTRIDRLHELAAVFEREAFEPDCEAFHGVAVALRQLAALADSGREALVTVMLEGRGNGGCGFVVHLDGPMPPWRRQAWDRRREEQARGLREAAGIRARAAMGAP